jgi:CTP synthase (UTP-ammonia lyase)
MSSVVRIALVGDFNPEYRSHHATNAALDHAAAHLNMAVEYVWIPTTRVEHDADHILNAFHGVWATAGSPYRSMEGMLRAIEFARTRMWPFVAT